MLGPDRVVGGEEEGGEGELLQGGAWGRRLHRRTGGKDGASVV